MTCRREGAGRTTTRDDVFGADNAVQNYEDE